AEERPGPAAEHALGAFYLADRQFDKAIEHLRTAADTDQMSAVYHSDFGAALLEKARADSAAAVGRSDRLDEPDSVMRGLAESLEHLSRAINLEPSLLEAAFNRALCYQLMVLPQQEEEAWKYYLDKDQSSPWADEARRSLARLEDLRKKTSRTNEE